MEKDKIIKVANKWLKSIPDLRRDIRIIDRELKNGGYEIHEIEKLNREREKMRSKLNSVVGVLEKLEDVEQRIVCYRYIDKLKIKDIALRTGYSIKTITKKLNQVIPLVVGRNIFGMEDEFWIDIIG